MRVGGQAVVGQLVPPGLAVVPGIDSPQVAAPVGEIGASVDHRRAGRDISARGERPFHLQLADVMDRTASNRRRVLQVLPGSKARNTAPRPLAPDTAPETGWKPLLLAMRPPRTREMRTPPSRPEGRRCLRSTTKLLSVARQRAVATRDCSPAGRRTQGLPQERGIGRGPFATTERSGRKARAGRGPPSVRHVSGVAQALSG